MVACSGAVARMKVDNYSRVASSDEQVLVASASGSVNGSRAGRIEFGSYVFPFSESCKHKYVKGICISLVSVIKYI